MSRSARALLAPLLLLAASGAAAGQADPVSRSWNQRVRPFRVIGNIYYVGASDLTAFLIAGPRGHILLDGGLAETAPLILASIRALGFKPEDVKLLLNSHAHYDHAGGLAELKRRTGAALLASAEDAALLARGGAGDFRFGDTLRFEPVAPDRTVRDGERVTLGGDTLVAHVTPGHTKGCTTWTATVRDDARTYGVVFVCSASVLDYRLVANPEYPGIVADFRRTFRTLRALRCDVFLAPHGSFFRLREKMRRLASHPRANPFIDPAGCRAYIDGAERAFGERLRRQESEAARNGGAP